MSKPASKKMEERCDHDERDHGICLHCGKQTDMNAHDYVSEESSPAPNEVEERIREIEQKHTKCSGIYVTTHYKSAFKELASLAAELGKEREAERSGGRVNSSAFWCDNRHVVDYEEAFNIERDLLAQNAQLKRELADAKKERDQLKRENENTWRAHGEMFSRNLALSSAYQRQKEALENILKMTAGHYGIELEANKALAETPDGSLLERVIALAQMAESESEFTINKLGHRVSTGGLVQLRNEARSLLSTLQPDHQK